MKFQGSFLLINIISVQAARAFPMTTISRTHISSLHNPISVIQRLPFLFSLHLRPFQQFKFTICLAGLLAYFLFKTVAGP